MVRQRNVYPLAPHGCPCVHRKGEGWTSPLSRTPRHGSSAQGAPGIAPKDSPTADAVDAVGTKKKFSLPHMTINGSIAHEDIRNCWGQTRGMARARTTNDSLLAPANIQEEADALGASSRLTDTYRIALDRSNWTIRVFKSARRDCRGSLPPCP